MDRRSKILLVCFLILILASAAITYYRYMVLEAFTVTDSSAQ